MRKLFIMILVIFGINSPSFAGNATLSQLKQLLAQKEHPVRLNKLEANNGLNQAAESLKIKYRFVLFYMSTCPHCQRFDPIIRKFIDHYGFKITAYTLNGQSLPSFANSEQPDLQTTNVFFARKGAQVPALFLLNTKNLHVYTVSIGETSLSRLIMRVNRLAPKILEYEKDYFYAGEIKGEVKNEIEDEIKGRVR